MNGVQLTFFNFAGYLIPGILFSITFLPALYLVPEFYWFSQAIDQLRATDDGSFRAATIAVLFLPSLAWCFVVGVLVSDSAFLVIKPLQTAGFGVYRTHNRSVFDELSQDDRQTVLAKDQRIREFIAQHATSGMDLYGLAARARMCLACGFAFVINSSIYLLVSITAFVDLLVTGSYLILLGMKRHADYLVTVDVVAFVETNLRNELNRST